jgi:Bacterial capsule synthesis protein PGA_cap
MKAPCRIACIVFICGTSTGAGVNAGPELLFRDACAAGTRAKVAAVGDLLFQRRLQAEALQVGGSYRNFWRSVERLLASADVTYANLEGVAAQSITYDGDMVLDVGRRWDRRVHGAPNILRNFNYHPSLFDDLKASGVDVLSTANNHALDRGWAGVDQTIDNISERGIAFTGTRKRWAKDAEWSVITPANGLAIAWLACTYGTNGRPDFHGQVLLCFQNRNLILKEIRRLAGLPGVDAVIFIPHWGVENTSFVLLEQTELARDAFAAGATAIIGTHPHVLQRWEKLVGADGREGVVIYSTGDFISDRSRKERRAGVIVWLELLKEAGAIRARLSAAAYVPTSVRAGRKYRVVEIEKGGPTEPLPHGNRLEPSRKDPMPRSCALASD